MLVSSGWSFNKLMQEKRCRGFKNSWGEANFVCPKESWKQQSLHLNLHLKTTGAKHSRGEASCSDSELESRDQSLSSLLPRFAHARQQHRVHPVLRLVEGTIPQVLWHARDVAVLPIVNSGEQAAELPDLMQERGQKLESENEDFKYLSMLTMDVQYLLWIFQWTSDGAGLA